MNADAPRASRHRREGRYLVDQAAIVFTALGLDLRFVEREVATMSEYRLAKTASRSVVGSMNDFAFLAGAHGANGVGDLVALSLHLAHTPCGPLRTSTGFPDLEVRAPADRVSGGNER